MKQSKAATLQMLSTQIKSAFVLPMFRINAKCWYEDSAQVIDEFLRTCKWANQPLIVRSSGISEDSQAQSLAGHYLSKPDVIGVEALEKAIGEVVESFGQAVVDDEVFIQPMLKDVAVSGVVFTMEPSSGAPYCVLSSDNSGSTDSVTSGNSNNIQTTYIAKSGLCENKTLCSPWQQKILRLCLELEGILDNNALDIEFGIDIHNRLYLFQVRNLIVNRINLVNETRQSSVLKSIASSIRRLSQPHPYLFGKKSIFGVMPDWNPAEIIGIRPRPLALSLYKELITDATWAYQRDNYGYRKLRSFPLLVNFHGLPYIDVRVSFNSFLPAETDSEFAEKLIDYYLGQLQLFPEKHDKVEFDIIHSCYTLDIDTKLDELKKHDFSDAELYSFKKALRTLTNNIINPQGLWRKDIDKIALLPKKREQIYQSDLPTLDKIYWLLEDCKRYGTLPFAGLARAGFIAVQLLQSMVTVGVLSESEYHRFMGSLNTVNSQMSKDYQQLSQAMFLEKYGHLRPGTYNILSPRYDTAPEDYFSEKAPLIEQDGIDSQEVFEEFSLTLDQLEKLENLLLHHGLNHDVISLFRFIKGAIEGREYAKFIFTHSLSDAIELLSELGHEYDLTREQVSFLDCTIVKQLYSDANDGKHIMINSINKGKEQYRKASQLILPPIICDASDVYCFEQLKSEPNFITLDSVEAHTCTEKLSPERVLGKIVFIQSADPGFDWLFSNKIAGLVTQYGGANSHMAIRAGELGIPSVIGAGEANYRKWSKARYLRIDSANQQVMVLH